VNNRIAIVHEWFTVYAGAERVIEQMLAVLPDADLYGLVDFMPAPERAMLGGRPVGTSFIQRLPFARKKFRAYLALMPLAVEQFDFSNYEVVVSSHHVVANGAMTRADQLHISYVHTPARYAWDLGQQYLQQGKLTRGVRSMLARSILHYLRIWDRGAADRVDVFVANSRYVARRIWKTYRRKARVIYPPVDVAGIEPSSDKSDYYLTASRMVPYKRIELIVEAFRKMPNRKLVVVGDGPERKKVEAQAGPNVELLGYQPTEKLRDLMRHARAFVFAADEDFGIVPVEAQASGTPVIAFRRGGVTETVAEGVTGLFFDEQTVPAICEAIERFETTRDEFEPERIHAHAEAFDSERFRQKFSSLVERQWAKHIRRGRKVARRSDLVSHAAR
jgi:glycosyltransferase involved in cell wall biosynthesis